MAIHMKCKTMFDGILWSLILKYGQAEILREKCPA